MATHLENIPLALCLRANIFHWGPETGSFGVTGLRDLRVCHSGSLPHINKDKIFFIGVPKRGRLESRGYAICGYIIQEYLRTLLRMKYFSLGFHNGDVLSHGATLLAGFSFRNTYAHYQG